MNIIITYMASYYTVVLLLWLIVRALMPDGLEIEVNVSIDNGVTFCGCSVSLR